ncbi:MULTISPECIES: hypothetical protein [unclassified Ruminococcus]
MHAPLCGRFCRKPFSDTLYSNQADFRNRPG